MEYFTTITPFEAARRTEAIRLVSAKRKALCEQVMAKYEGKKRKKK